MPSGDRSGPQGEGPKTGRGLGYCNDNDQPSYAAPQQAQGFGFRRGGRGRGRGFSSRRGWRNRSSVGFLPGRGRGGSEVLPDAQVRDISSLKAQMQELQNVLKDVQNRLDQSEKKKG